MIVIENIKPKMQSGKLIDKTFRDTAQFKDSVEGDFDLPRIILRKRPPISARETLSVSFKQNRHGVGQINSPLTKKASGRLWRMKFIPKAGIKHKKQIC